MKERRIRKGIVIWIVLVLLTAMVVITIPTNVSAAGPWYVNGVTGNNVWDGTSPIHPPNPPGNLIGPWKTISHAVGHATVVNGDTINVAAATYPERFTISKGISLIGADASTTIIDGTWGGDVVTTNADDVTIEKFTIKNSKNAAGNAGIELAGIAANKITGCKIYDIILDTNYYGIHLNHADDNTIGRSSEDITIIDNIYGIVLGNSGRKVGDTIHKNTFERIIITSESTSNSEDDGINLVNSDYNEFTNIDIDQDWDLWSTGAIYLQNADSNTFDTLTVKNYKFEVIGVGEFQGDGFWITSSSDSNVIENCDIINTRNGISLHGIIANCEFNIIQNNNINSNNQDGIRLESCDRNSILNNKIYDNGLYGIFYSDSESGIYLKNSDFNIIEDNEIYDNDADLDDFGDGIRLSSSDDNKIEGNEIYNTLDPVFGDLIGNQQYGIYLKQSYDNEIINNNLDLTDPADNLEGIHHNILDGIHLYNCQDVEVTEVNEIRGNKINKNLENGIYLEISHKVKIIKDSSTSTMNEIFDNEENGILLDNSDSNTIEENEIYNTEDGNQQNGIYLYRSDSNWYINKNDIYENNEDGILLENSKDNILEENEIYNTEYGNQQNGIHLKAEFIAPSTYLPSILNKIQNLNIIYTNDKNGIFIEKCVDPTQEYVNWVKDNIIYSNKEDGIYLKESDSHWIEGNEIYDVASRNQQNGIHLLDSNDNFILNHNQDLDNDWIFGIYFNGGNGIYLDSSDGNIVEGNIIHDNDNWGTYGSAGILVSSSSDNSLNENVIWAQAWGMYLQSDSDSNTILRCRIENNYNWGVAIDNPNCNDNKIYRNNFYYNNPYADPKPEGPGQAWDLGSNTWDDGYITGYDELGNPLNGGNHWIDWINPDAFIGPNQDIPGADTIVDLGEPGGGLNPYTIYGGNEEDRYPFKHELIVPDWWY